MFAIFDSAAAGRNFPKGVVATISDLGQVFDLRHLVGGGKPAEMT
ncbi:hypothetical protein [Roseovarius pelagicus]|uniref:Uncharacterized protein n=1 Tax=Roseovarius pelagicus TaxID=2980108 RepID=A0ABY6DBG9_9RHOB|nr:hypothetical protein [Roseovarius pelagicus]UXX83467.1 hypothetical protein N7U68_01940 [Roseovarius pelagicus]